MFRFQKTPFLVSFSLSLIFFFIGFNSIYAYVTVPRNIADTTDRMNGGGDPLTDQA